MNFVRVFAVEIGASASALATSIVKLVFGVQLSLAPPPKPVYLVMRVLFVFN
jgi:hypothetical protein